MKEEKTYLLFRRSTVPVYYNKKCSTYTFPPSFKKTLASNIYETPIISSKPIQDYKQPSIFRMICWCILGSSTPHSWETFASSECSKFPITFQVAVAFRRASQGSLTPHVCLVFVESIEARPEENGMFCGSNWCKGLFHAEKSRHVKDNLKIELFSWSKSQKSTCSKDITGQSSLVVRRVKAEKR